MQSLGTTKGIVLLFESLDDLRGTVKNLSGMLEWVESENIHPPHLYSSFDDRIDKDEVENILDDLKKRLQ